MKVRAETAKVFVECSFYQVLVACPLTEYGTLFMSETSHVLENIGDAFTGLNNVIRTLPRDSKIFTPPKIGHHNLGKNNNRMVIPLWESHKQSQIVAQEQLLRLIDGGPFRPVLQRLLVAMAERTGTIPYDQHGWKMALELGPAG